MGAAKETMRVQITTGTLDLQVKSTLMIKTSMERMDVNLRI